jgi:hypothetical protein
MAVAELKTYVCDSCNGTYTGDVADLTREGWKRHLGKHQVPFLMCDSCEEHYGPIWAKAEKSKPSGKS